MPEKKSKEKKMLLYRGKPLLRENKIIYYGDFNENFVVRITELETKKINKMDVATKLDIELLEKHGDSIAAARLTKKAERTSLWAALDLGVYWLEDILEMEKEFLAKLQAAQS